MPATLEITQPGANVRNDDELTGAPVVAIRAANVRFTNGGKLTSDDFRIPAIVIDAEGAIVVNEAGAEIVSGDFGGISIQGSEFADTVINEGVITSLMQFGGGNDLLIVRSGGDISADMGAGDDTLRYEGSYAWMAGIAGGTGYDRIVFSGNVGTAFGFEIEFEAIELASGVNVWLSGYSGLQALTIGTGGTITFLGSNNPGLDLDLGGHMLTLMSGTTFRNVTGSDMVETVTMTTHENKGSTLVGSVDLGGGNDIFTLNRRDGDDAAPSVGGTVDAGSGADILKVEANGVAVDLGQYVNFETLIVSPWFSDPAGMRLTNIRDISLITLQPDTIVSIASTDLPSATLEAPWTAGITVEADTILGAIRSGAFTALSGFSDSYSLDIVNLGSVTGAVRLSPGHDVYDGRTGSVGGGIYGFAGNDRIDAGSGNDLIDGGAGADAMAGGAGDDVYFVDNIGDSVTELAGQGTDEVRTTLASYALGANVERLTGTSASGQTLTGNGAANIVTGGAGNDRIDGGAGVDSLIGGTGNDSYFVDEAGDLVTEISGQGHDVVSASASYRLGAGASVEVLTARTPASTAAIDLAGNELPNAIYGSAGANVIDGGGGADVMFGLAGDDQYYTDHSGDLVIESAGNGHDVVHAAADFALGAGSHVEVLLARHQSSAAPINLAGNELNQAIYGSVGNNSLNGGGGADVMFGFAGDDFYFADNLGDLVIEAAGEGNDAVFASASFVLTAGSHVEVLLAQFQSSTAAIDLTGNELDNAIYGSAGSNRLTGGGGVDVMFGFAGDDSYFTDNAGDLAIEAAGQGYDVVYAAADFTLSAGSHVEVLLAQFQSSSAPINLTGNELNNIIYGSVGANRLSGGAGADYLFGFAGDDSYFVDNAGDFAIEAAGEGHDIVYASASHALAAGSHVEVLLAQFQSSSAAIDLAGNELGNVIYGSVGANTISGKGGLDILFGYSGADRFVFDTSPTGGNYDYVADFEAGVDKIVLDNAVFTALADGALSSGAFRTGTAAADADDRIVYDPQSGALFYDSDGSGAGGAVLVAMLAAGLPLQASDFAII